MFPVKNENLPKNLKLKSAKCRYNSNAVVSDCGKVFFWPIIKDNVFYPKPIELLFPTKISITNVALGFNFSIFLTNAGLLYSMGSENNEGQLGHGDLKIRPSPTLIESLRNSGDKITAVECGFKHAIAKSSLGKVFKIKIKTIKSIFFFHILKDNIIFLIFILNFLF
jgi:alpha-tubulin suppressor-like RCC1 family protein